MKEIIEQITPSLVNIAVVVLTAVFSWVGVQLKLWLDTKQKRDIVEASVKYVEQVGKSLGSEEKFAQAKEKAIELLNSVHIKVGEAEIDVLIEAAVNSFFGKYN